jgi:hypothetical protein
MFIHAALEETNLTGAKAQGANFTGAVYAGRSLEQGDFTGATFNDAILAGVRRRRGPSAGASLQRTDLTGSALAKADLVGGRTCAAPTSPAPRLTGAVFTGAKVHRLRGTGVSPPAVAADMGGRQPATATAAMRVPARPDVADLLSGGPAAAPAPAPAPAAAPGSAPLFRQGRRVAERQPGVRARSQRRDRQPVPELHHHLARGDRAGAGQGRRAGRLQGQRRRTDRHPLASSSRATARASWDPAS